MQRSESIAQLAAALSKAQSKFPLIKRDAENPFFRSRYSDLGSIIETVQPSLAENELSVTQLPSTDIEQQCVVINTILMHASGEFIGSEFRIPVPDWKAQGLGSATTYARRYSLQAILNVAPDSDDDGNGASRPNDHQPAAKPTSKSTEITGLKKSIVDVCQLLNQHGDEPKWTAKRVNEFANQHFGLNADALELEPMRELVQKLSLRLDDLKKKPKHNGDQGEKERQSFIEKILKAPEKNVREALMTLGYDKPLVDLTLDQLVAVHEEVVPF